MYLDTEGNPIVDKSLYGQLAAGIPGTVAGMEEAHKKIWLPFLEGITRSSNRISKKWLSNHGYAGK